MVKGCIDTWTQQRFKSDIIENTGTIGTHIEKRSDFFTSYTVSLQTLVYQLKPTTYIIKKKISDRNKVLRWAFFTYETECEIYYAGLFCLINLQSVWNCNSVITGPNVYIVQIEIAHRRTWV